MRNFFTTSDIARLCDRSRATAWNWAKAGKIPGLIRARRANRRGKHYRIIDSPELRMWCEIERRREAGILDGILAVIEGTVLGAIERDYRADPERVIVQEIRRQLRESDDPDQLLKKWKRATVDRRPEDLPRVDLARMSSDVHAEILRQLLDSKNPEQLLTKWARAFVNQRFNDLPRVL